MVVRGVNCQCWGGMGSLWTVPGDQTKARGAERPEGVNNHAASLRSRRYTPKQQGKNEEGDEEENKGNKDSSPMHFTALVLFFLHCVCE